MSMVGSYKVNVGKFISKIIWIILVLKKGVIFLNVLIIGVFCVSDEIMKMFIFIGGVIRLSFMMISVRMLN